MTLRTFILLSSSGALWPQPRCRCCGSALHASEDEVPQSILLGVRPARRAHVGSQQPGHARVLHVRDHREGYDPEAVTEERRAARGGDAGRGFSL